MGFEVEGLPSRVQGLGSRVKNLKFRGHRSESKEGNAAECFRLSGEVQLSSNPDPAPLPMMTEKV